MNSHDADVMGNQERPYAADEALGFRESEIPANAYLPFGIGPRACIGRRFAMMEGPLILAELARQFEFELPDPGFEPQLENRLTLHPRNGLQLRLKRRSEVQASASAQNSV